MKLNQIVNQENLNMTPPEGFDPEDVSDETQVQVVEDTSAMDQDIAAADAEDGAISDGITSVDQLSDVQDAVNDEIEATGDVSEGTATLVETTLESIMGNLGYKAPVIPTTESLDKGQRGQRIVATLESERASLTDRIKSALKSALDTVLRFIENLVRNSWVLGKYLDFVRKKVDALPSGQHPSKDRMTESAATLSAAGKADSLVLDEMFDTAVSMMQVSAKASILIKEINFKFSDPQTTAVPAEAILLQNNGCPKNPSGKNTYGFLTNSRTVAEKTGMMFDNRVNHIEKAGDVAPDIEVASVETMKKRLNEADTLIKMIKKFDSEHSKLKNAVSRVLQYLAQDFSHSAGVVSKSAREFSTGLGKIRGIRQLLLNVTGKFPLESFKIAKAFIDYSRHSLKYYSGGKDSKSDDQSAAKSGEPPRIADSGFRRNFM